LSKLEALSDALAAALKARNVLERQAVLAATAGIAAFADATLSWLDEESPGLTEQLCPGRTGLEEPSLKTA
jgi:hypothetical protein